MATELSAISLPNIIVPQVVPGGQFVTPEEEDFRSGLQDIINNLVETVNILIDNSNETITTIGTGGLDKGCRVIAHTPVGVDLNTGSFTCLTQMSNSLRLHTSGQLILSWREYTGSGNLFNTRVIKSVSPYVVWTNLEGDSQEPTTIAPGIAETNKVGMYVEHTATQDLIFYFQNSATGDLVQQTYTFDGENFSAGSTSTVLSGLTTSVWSNDILCNDDYLVMALDDGTLSRPCRVYTAPADSPHSWTQVAHFGDAYYSGSLYGFAANSNANRQLIDLGDGRILLLFEVGDTSGRKNIAWAMSEDSGGTWPVGDTATNPTVYELNYPGQASGFVIPQSGGGVWATGNLVFDGRGKTWKAAHITGTSRVGLVYLADYLAAAGTKTGVLYCEFNADELEWTAQADHVQMTPQNLSYNGSNYRGLMNRQGGPVVVANSGAQMITGNDGLPRVFFINGTRVGTGTNGEDIMLSIGYRRPDTISSDITETAEWWSQKEIFHFYPLSGGDQTEPRFIQSEVEACRDGLVTISNQEYLPIVWNRRINSLLTRYMAEWEICFKLIPVALMDLP